MRKLIVLAVVIAPLAACSASSTISAADASQFFRQSVDGHYHGKVPTGDGRGCVKISAGHFSCTAYVSGQGLDVIGTVTVSGDNMTTRAHEATGAAIQAWFAKTGGVQ